MTVAAKIGTWEWAHQTGGKLGQGEKAELISVVEHLSQSRGSKSDKASTGASVDFDKIRIPDSRVCREALEFCRELSPEALTNHCLRTYMWGNVFAQQEQLQFDEELFYVAAILHDLGLTPRYNNRPEVGCFAVEGALGAKEFAAGQGWDEARQIALAEAICLHLNLKVDLSQGVEAHLLQAGAALDVIGARMTDIDPATLAKVLEIYPRFDFKKEVTRLLLEQVKQRPDSRIAFLVNQVGFAARIEKAPFAN